MSEFTDKSREIVVFLYDNGDKIKQKLIESEYNTNGKEWIIEEINGHNLVITKSDIDYLLARHPHLEVSCKESEDKKLDTANKILEKLKEMLDS